MFKYILIIFLLIAFVPAIRTFLFNILVGNQIAKQQKRYNDFMEKERGKEGEIKVKTTKTSNKNTGFDSGQYVDYEEVK
ncbi:hypothetical protein EMA8858_00858 [Emticicia aquatica]|uniref:DUF4834 domain-containing protein n=1 Tax=Emticicia aquatica TaxID=1681835 RepID=A0ABN8ES56_9BACT|nr:DUF4834 family protein [Emticicia aquatica]CAH0994746.1 hypothetical protein EMA8858_00858 [Emticicia aquatica]